MSKNKLQVCVSYKHTKEEEDLYIYTINQGDKSVFIKNLIRAHRDGRILDVTMQPNQTPMQNVVDATQVDTTSHINNGKKTKNKFLA